MVLTAKVLVTAVACENQLHGLLRLLRIVRRIEHGYVNPGGEIGVVQEETAVATVDTAVRVVAPLWHRMRLPKPDGVPTNTESGW